MRSQKSIRYVWYCMYCIYESFKYGRATLYYKQMSKNIFFVEKKVVSVLEPPTRPSLPPCVRMEYMRMESTTPTLKRISDTYT